jgi:hypothetical protein
MARRALRSFSEGGLRATESSAFLLEMPRAGARGASLRPDHAKGVREELDSNSSWPGLVQPNEAPRSKLRGILRNSPKPLPSSAKASEGSPRLHPRSSLLRRSSHFGYEGRKLRGMRRRRINETDEIDQTDQRDETAVTCCNAINELKLSVEGPTTAILRSAARLRWRWGSSRIGTVCIEGRKRDVAETLTALVRLPCNTRRVAGIDQSGNGGIVAARSPERAGRLAHRLGRGRVGPGRLVVVGERGSAMRCSAWHSFRRS